jgi:aspartyl/glutamyl-tRNA(Asn/Gln) amidotransferase, B subunit
VPEHIDNSSIVYDTVVGLEVHIQMNTSSKAFCGDANTFGALPNTHVSAVSLAHPGTLPVANEKHIYKAIQLGLALDCEINELHYFDRKHYFYPDLPKGYQITQDNRPICLGGHLDINLEGKQKRVRIHHIHMEEDAGKSVHDKNDKWSLVDLNRAGTPLLELVTEPDLSSAEEVYIFIQELQRLLRFVAVSDADMEKGSMRCDCNVSVKPAGSKVLGERCEIKNLNSKRFARDAVIYEAQRQIAMLERGQTFTKQTLHYDPVQQVTSLLREKEGVADYRYFPDPDLPPMTISRELVDQIKLALPELPAQIKQRLIHQNGLSEDYADQITKSQEIYRYFESLATDDSKIKAAANLLINQILPSLETDAQDVIKWPLSTDRAKLYLDLISSGKVNKSSAHQILWPKWQEGAQGDIESLATQLGLIIEQDDNTLQQLIDDLLAKNPKQVAEYKQGKKALLGFFIGAAMRAHSGNIDAKELKAKLMEQLAK